jgi:quercetin dioxygenase-like cupin family protein
MHNMIKGINEIPEEKVDAGKDTYRQVLIGSDQGPNFAMRRFVIKPGGSMPRHTNTVEHEQFVLNGRAKICIGDKVYEAKKNDVVFIPAGTPHWYQVEGDESFEFLCIVPNLEDKVAVLA